jgi:hypothetical protein
VDAIHDLHYNYFAALLFSYVNPILILRKGCKRQPGAFSGEDYSGQPGFCEALLSNKMRPINS